VIVYLHGGDERGDDAVSATQVGLGPVVQRSQGAFPFIVIFPQAPRGSYFGMPDNNARVLAALDEVLARFHGDPERVYLTGNSLGGFGTWFLGALEARRFAALVPICGGVRGRAPRDDAPFAAVPEDERPREIARRLRRTPVWIFHGADDWLVPVRFSRELYQALRAEGADVRYTEYPGVGHASWERAYAEPGLFDWLAAQRRKP
jgi:predicted peptidase